ncbi:cistern family PEP-CTERM protein [Leptolyngbya sp. FACHB-321]|uniref:cistern family PEP-CTERM protein n=1 Tax=Leptolyngbya sp. FACHB-321 TaxID=2692807 RepID=UPI00168249C4|nr:cistern family PEP-CTERM protein [Leptolyngbya sp. FACHB-321]MBD2033736.1 cistern family PEP-CTERM protein [Leptolyngbya sp. FACHB-321]
MTKTNSFLKGAALTGAALTLGLLSTGPVHAFTFAPGKTSVIVEASDINKSFTVEFDGNVERQNVTGLTAEAIFTFLGFTTSGSNTNANFSVNLTNTSSGNPNNPSGIFSRVSALGFDVGPNLIAASTTGFFPGAVRNSAFPNQFGDIEVCFKGGQTNNCQGGTGTGLFNGQTDTFNPVLTFAGSVTSFTLSNFGVRYQSIDGNGFNDDSGTGRGKVPTPALLPGLLALGAGVWRKRKGEQSAEAKAEV